MGNIQNGIIEKAIQKSFRLSAPVLKPYGAVWKVHSASGCFILKQVQRDPEQIRQLDAHLTEIRATGFEGVPEIFKQRTGDPFMEYAGRYYILMPWYPGENPSFQNQKQIERVAALYGMFHRASQEATKNLQCSPQNLIVEFTERVDFLEKTLDNLRITQLYQPQALNRIDRSLLNWGDHFLWQARVCLSGLIRCCKEISSVPAGFCHNDPAPRNIIIQSPQWKLIDFELSGINLYIRELAVLTSRMLAASQWQTMSIQNIFSVYGAKRPIDNAEARLFPYSLGFPQSFWRVCHQRYVEKLARKEHYFQEKIWTMIHQEPDRIKSLTSLCPELTPFADTGINGRADTRELSTQLPLAEAGGFCASTAVDRSRGFSSRS